MNFKHDDFGSSEVMRSLERVAQEKGLVKPDSILQKLASRPAVKKADVVPTSNLMENILKLCEGLKDQGLVAVANELEANYFQFKQAQTLYEAHKEKGEDLIHAAHPDGSHKLEGVDSEEATFEDILDKHVKILQKIEKKPTGKLESVAHVLSEVKKALGQNTTSLDDIKNLVSQVKKKIDTVIGISNDELTFSVTSYGTDIGSKLVNPTVYNLSDVKDKIFVLHHRLDPSALQGNSYGITGVSDYTWNRVQPLLNQATNLINEAIIKRKEYDSGEQSKLEGNDNTGVKKSLDTTASQSVKVYQALLNQIKRSLNVAKFSIDSDQDNTAQDKQNADAFIDRILTYLTNNIEGKFNAATDKDIAAEGLMPTLNKLNAKVLEFSKQWVG